MNAPSSPSPLAGVALAPRDPILGLNEAFNADKNPNKVNLGVGVYTDDNGKVPLLECVRRAEAERELKAAKADLAVVELTDIATDDVWCRDHGPIFVKDDRTGEVALTDWEFHGWGGKFEASLDNQVPGKVAAKLGVKKFSYPFELEGGGIEVSGDGLLLTTEAVQNNPNRAEGRDERERERPREGDTATNHPDEVGRHREHDVHHEHHHKVGHGRRVPRRLAGALAAADIPILGTSPDAIDICEDRRRFNAFLVRLKATRRAFCRPKAHPQRGIRVRAGLPGRALRH